MKSKIFVYGACVLALVACNQEKQAPAAITPNSTDDQKFAYMLGTQMGEHAFGPLEFSSVQLLSRVRLFVTP